MFQSQNDDKLQLSVFHQHIEKIAGDIKLTNLQAITDAELIKHFLEIKALDISYDSIKKVIVDVELARSCLTNQS